MAAVFVSIATIWTSDGDQIGGDQASGDFKHVAGYKTSSLEVIPETVH